ncbi:MAG: elongation factor 4 [Candidatus Colwellbacteria bacterium]|nr:elongation factor 4 [Candidatus Colwellbacteria bacterium]
MSEQIRNFVVISHIDHGKSTLADRLLEATGTVPPRKMKEQYLDALELERERGITIKMAPVRMQYKNFILNLIDTPGHSDFSYEVSRALGAVEGAVLLVDATQGIQAQTLANLEAAQNAGLKIIGALNKIDLNPPGLKELEKELAKLINVSPQEIRQLSARTGEGVSELLEAIVESVPPPKSGSRKAALIFSSLYDEHKGVIAFVRVFSGEFRAGETTRLQATKKNFKIKEAGYFLPELGPTDILGDGEIGYLATGIKEPDAIKIGDTIGDSSLPGFRLPQPVVFVSLYPGLEADYEDLKNGLNKLKLNDAALSFSPDSSQVLGRGFRCGFLGRLHFEITIERLKREFNLELIHSFPSVIYGVKTKAGEKIIEDPKDFPDEYLEAKEPVTKIKILTPARFLGPILELTSIFRLTEIRTTPWDSSGDRFEITATLPLADLILDFDDKLKSVSQGFASFSYELAGYQPVKVSRLDILVAGEKVPGLSRVIPNENLESEARGMTAKLKALLKRQQFAQAVQAAVGTRVIARETIPALRKHVTGNLYGGDRTRKMKLWQKQQKGKKRLKERGRVEVPLEVFRELLKK